MQLQLKTLLNRVHHFKGFVYEDVRLVAPEGKAEVHIEARIVARKNSKPNCGACGKSAGGYDHQDERSFLFVPLWGVTVYLLYTPRRVNCHQCGVRVEDIPWARGKSPMTKAMMCFLATWAKRMSWLEVGRAFGVSWDYVCNAVTWVVEYGLAHQDLSGISAIGVDEISHKMGHKFITLVYQIDAGCRRLLWIGEGHTQKTLQGFFTWFGEERSAALKFICSDMWQGFIKVIRLRAKGALHVLDKFHIVANLHKAVDETRRREAAELRRQGEDVTLKHTRWCLLKKVKNLTKKQYGRLKDLLRLNLRTVRAYLLLSPGLQ